MSRFFRIVLCSLLTALFLFPVVGSRAEAERTSESVEFLISAVAQSHLTFVRNGEKHTCEEAAAHIRRKYDYFQAKVKTPEDFIRLCASKSLLSGKPYLVLTEHGTVPVATWLEQRLAEHEKG